MSALDPLDVYNRKRDFKKTGEPRGKLDAQNGRRFVVQKHDARKLHFDLRLEMDGVLKSWAVTKGPSPNPDDKRLAVRTEDHPLDYGSFEGTIKKGQYGGGTVMLWDTGSWSPVAGKKLDLDKGHLHFSLNGKRMRGEWLLVKMRGRETDKRENWLLRKVDDAFAGSSDELVARQLTSVKSERTMAEIARGSKQAKRKHALPKFRKPQLATLVDEVPAGNEWLHEIKYDGYRALIAAAGEEVRIFTRSGKDWTHKFKALAQAVRALNLPSVLIDAEIVALDHSGNPSFSALQQALKEGQGGLTLFAFDLLEIDGQCLEGHATIERKERLAALLPEQHDVVRFAEHIVGAGEELYRAMCEAGQEGVISKRIDAPYRHKRSFDWLKVKCVRRQEFVILGWRKSDKKHRPFASLLLGQYEDGELHYRGRVGAGFRGDDLERLGSKLHKLERKTPPADVPRSEARDAHWVTPKLVAEVAFSEFTAEQRVRHGRYIGLREDKAPDEVSVERPTVAAGKSAEARVSENPGVAISNRERVIFPESKATKGDLADYYLEVGPLLLPHIAHRPISLVRCPQGRQKKCFFQKHNPGSFGDDVHAVAIKQKDGSEEDYLYVKDLAGILSCVQMGTIEFHGWGSLVSDLELPDRVVFDLDPDEGLDFDHVKSAAREIRSHLNDLGLVSFVMLSGGKGIHVIAPLRRKAPWPEVKDFAKRLSLAMAQASPERFTATMSKQKRKGKVFIDWLRNERGATSIVPYSVRARPSAPVAAPVAWEELDAISEGARFTIADAAQLLERARSRSLRHWGSNNQTLPDA